MESEAERIERLQAEMKQNILLAIKEATKVDVTITIDDPIALANLLEQVWVRSVDFGYLDFSDPDAVELNIDAYGKRDELEDLV